MKNFAILIFFAAILIDKEVRGDPCSPPETPKNGKAIYTSLIVGSVANYECKFGFTLVGESTRKCGADQKWVGEIPVCKVSAATTTTETPDEDEDADWDDEDDSSEADDDGRVYKNPRNSPSTLCPRDEEQATLLGQKCLRKCSSDEDCKSKKKKCLCDGACGMSCIKPDRECPELSQPSIGTVTMSGRFFGSRAVYTCPHGSHVVGLHSRLCQADGKWAGAEPACKKNIYCLTPPTIEHARHSALPEQTTFDLDSTVQYHCHIGYVTNGFPRAKCLAIDGKASWYGPDISCEPRSCGQPPDPAHGWHAGECYTFGCRITNHCGEGYELVGKQERFCQADGSWSPKELPTCVLVTAVQCPLPEDPKNGKAIYTSTSYNSVVSYECKYGFTLIGESSRRCGADRKWSGQIPACKEINCGHPGILYNGWLENIESGTGLGASIIFRCHPGMLLSGHTSTVCQIDGKWRYPVPQCLAPCVVPTISQGTVSPIDTDVDLNSTTTLATIGLGSISKVKHGTTLEVFCEEHYEFPISSLSPPTCNNGTWSVIPRCVPARCKAMPKPPKNGMVLAPKTEHGMKARFKCKDGFNLTGPGGKEVTDPNLYVLACSFGNWTGETPMCQEVYCAFPGYIPNGKVLLVGNMGLYDYRPYVKKVVNNKQIMYECDKGYVFLEQWGPPGATCIGGKWSPQVLPVCIPGQHPRLRWNRRRRRSALNDLVPPERRHLRTKFLLQHYRYLDRWKRDLNPHPEIQNHRAHHSRMDSRIGKRSVDFPHSILFKRQVVLNNIQNDLRNLIRKRRELSEVEQAYSKYYEKIKEKYRSYVKNLLGQSRNGNRNMRLQYATPHQPNGNEYIGDPEQTMSAGNNARSYQDMMRQTVSHQVVPIAIPNINEQNTHTHNLYYNHQPPTMNRVSNNDYELSHYYEKNRHDQDQAEHANNSRPNISSIIAQLKSQIVRRKRDTLELDKQERRRERQNRRANFTTQPTLAVDEDDDFIDGGRRGKPRGPCEPLPQGSLMSMEIVRSGRDPNVQFSSGIMVKVSCPKGFALNIVNLNSTAKCVRGRWKPMKPECIMLPCTVPSVDHGHYYHVQMDPLNPTPKPDTDPIPSLSTLENGQTVVFQCNDGFNVQGQNQLRCFNGDWAVPALPECIPSPCVLPSIPDAGYLGGYRAGLTIAHGSSVSIQCDHNGHTNLVQMDCSLGILSPMHINCGAFPPIRNIREDYIETVDKSNLMNVDFSLNLIGRDCEPPAKIQGAVIYKNGEPVDPEHDHGFPTGTEIVFNCISSSVGERSTWKIVCEDGEWIGRSFNCANGTCIFRNNEPHVVSFYNDLEIREEIVEFPPGATIVSRCVDIGKFSFTGSSVRQCIHSEWNGQKPACFGLNQENDYSMEKAPTILIRHQDGPIAQSNDGKLIVYPGTTVHMECLWMRRFGNPRWNVSHDYRKYPEGWSTDEGRDPQLEYRISIFHAVQDDSGIFSCQTPARHEHFIDIQVKPVNCPEIPQRRGLAVSTSDTKMGTRAQLSCQNGNALIGAAEILCLPSANWSAPLPVCESVECGDIQLQSQNSSTPRVAILSREVGGRAAFSCSSGFGLRGNAEALCLPTGEWATPFPVCMEVQCDNPGAPQNGYAQGSPPYRAGDIVQFTCNTEYMMEGQPIIACQDNGRWSGGLPKCVPACPYPGTAISGRMSLVKFYYAIGESITFTCDAGLEMRGAKMLKCLKNGKWSNAIPTCVHQDAAGNNGGGSQQRGYRSDLIREYWMNRRYNHD